MNSHDILDDSNVKASTQTSVASMEQNRMLRALEQAAGKGDTDSGSQSQSGSDKRETSESTGESWHEKIDDAQKDLVSKQAKLEDGLMGLMKRAQKQQSQLQGMNSFDTWMHGSA